MTTLKDEELYSRVKVHQRLVYTVIRSLCFLYSAARFSDEEN